MLKTWSCLNVSAHNQTCLVGMVLVADLGYPWRSALVYESAMLVLGAEMSFPDDCVGPLPHIVAVLIHAKMRLSTRR